MVESAQKQQTDYNTAITYATWRTDKPASSGYSQELISTLIQPKYYDALEDQPVESTLSTVLECFKRNVKEAPDADFIGWRVK